MQLPVSKPIAVRPGRPARLACAAVALLICSTIGAARASASTLRHTVRFDAGRVHLTGPLADRTLHVDGLSSTWEQGQPEIPFETVTLLVPPGSRVVGLRALAVGDLTLAEGIALRAAQPVESDAGTTLLPKPHQTAEIAAPAPEFTAYPAALAEYSGSGALHGYQMVSVRVYPVRWDAATRRVIASERIDLEVELAPGGTRPIQRERFSAAIEAGARRTIAELVANPEAIDGYDRRIGRLVEKSGGGFQPTDAPSLEGSDVDYVIITNDALAPSWQVLADWKTRRGVPTVVRTTEWIQQNYRRGSDLQETMRTFIKDAYAKWAVQYVLLAGDTDVLPARFGFSAFGDPTEQHIPTDMYFACLDGNWDKDGDNRFGEAALTVSDPGDSTDLYAEVFVGRGPFSTPAEVASFTAKIMGYENPTSLTYQSKALFLGEVLFPVNWDTSQAISMDGASFCEEMAGYLGACNTSQRLYENFLDYPGSLQLTMANARTEMNSGYGFVNHIGHGFRYNMSCGDRSFQNADALALTNGNKRFVLYMLNCTASAFDFPCLAEAFLDAAGGAVGVLGASRAAYALPSRNYNRGFMQAVYQNGYKHLGEVFVQSRIAQTPNAWFDTADHYSHLLYNFMGDPEMIMHTCNPGTTAVTHPASIGLGLVSVNVHVTVGGLAQAGALVCIQKGVEEYEFGTTNGSGDVTLAFRAETAGSAQITVTGQNMTAYLSTISVSNAGGPYVSATTTTVDDNLSGLSNGNNDGVVDAGETIELSASFTNSGTSTASTLTGKLRIPGGVATVADSVYTLANIAASASGSFTNDVRFSIPAATADGTVLPLTFVTTNGSATWTDVVNKVVHGPAMRLTLVDVDDSVTGNNDGIIQAGEVFDLVTYFKNYGTGAADGLTAQLTSSDPDVVITTGSISLGRANAMQEVSGATKFRLKENVIAENPMTLTLTDNRGRSLITPVTLRGPAAPGALNLDASTGANVVEVSWTPNADADLAGYHVYRGATPSGPWTRATVDRLARIAYFRNTGLSPSTLYYFYATAIDSSGNESTPSAVANINTNPAQLAGWPIGLAGQSSCTPAIGDITGEGLKEIVAGNDHLYAWTALGGIEVRDDDNDPQTWGVFSEEVKVVTGAIALGEMDRSSPGYETFVTSWDDSNKAYIVKGNGSFMPGWPRNPDFTTPQKGYWADAAAMDVDGDGLCEVWAPAKNGNLYSWHPNGNPTGASQAFKSGLGTFMRVSPSFANLDSDPYKEIIFGGGTGVLNIWNHDGSNFGTFPKTPGVASFANTAVGDVNHDGILDVVYLTEGGAVNCYNTKTGNQLAGFPVSLPIKSNPKCPSPALADFNFDGFLEIVVAFNHATASQSQVRVINYQGVTQPGWPIIPGGYTSESSPIVADVSGDGVPDILFGNEGGLLYGWSSTGQNLAGFPLTVGDFIRSVPTADDVDGDGGIDLVLMGWDKNVYIWDFPASYSKPAAQWPMLKHDVQRSGLYGYRPDDPTDVGDGGDGVDPAASRVPERAVLAQNMPNPFNPTTRIQYGIPASAAGGTPVRLEIFDAAGRKVRMLVNGTEQPGLRSAVWDGRNDRGQRVESGIFFYRLQVGSDVLTRKMILLK